MSVLAYFLIGVVFAPLLLLGLYAVCSYFNLKIADRILSLVVQFLTVELAIGGVVNLVGGLAISALGIWSVLYLDSAPHLFRFLAVLLVPFGLWRAIRGGVALRSVLLEMKAAISGAPPVPPGTVLQEPKKRRRSHPPR